MRGIVRWISRCYHIHRPNRGKYTKGVSQMQCECGMEPNLVGTIPDEVSDIEVYHCLHCGFIYFQQFGEVTVLDLAMQVLWQSGKINHMHMCKREVCDGATILA